MRTRLYIVMLVALVSLPWLSRCASGQAAYMPAPSPEAATVDSAASVLSEVMAIPARSIPASLLAKAEGIVIIPGMLKGGFIVGISRGRGVVVTRDETGRWKQPAFVQLTGASVGWQAGLEGTDLVLVFRTKTSLQNLMRGKITIGANASAAAGPVGRTAQAATDASLKAEILSYSRSRGLFAGVALDGAVLSVDQAATNAFYQAGNQPGQPINVPPSAGRLQQQLAKYTITPPAATGAAPVAATPARIDARTLRGQLAASSRQLAAVLDPSWRTYLALPAEVFAGDRPPSAEALRLSLDHFATVGADSRYQALSRHPEFQATWSLLRQYAVSVSPSTPQHLALPPPPR